MKKKIKKSKTKIKSKSKYKYKNPNYDVIIKRIINLIKKDVILYIPDGNPKSIQGTIPIYGILDPYYMGKLSLDHVWSFQFNPLSQWKYEKRQKSKEEKIQPIKRTNKDPEFIDYGNDFDNEMIIQAEFENDEPTFEFILELIDIADVVDNKIILKYNVKFDPNQIY